MCRYVDQIIQMRDGKVLNVITSPQEIRAIAGNVEHAESHHAEPKPAIHPEPNHHPALGASFSPAFG
jgi:hypothetical protein